LHLVGHILECSCKNSTTMWQIPDAVDAVVCAPDDGWWYHPKHVEQFPDKINCVTLHLVGYILECSCRNSTTIWQIPKAVNTVVCAPDDGWWYHPKHVEQFPDKINCVTLHLVGYILECSCRNSTTVWQISNAVDTVVCAPDDGWWYHPKHVEQFPDKINCVTLHLFGYILECSCRNSTTVWQIPNAVNTVVRAPDNGWWYHPKHVQQFPDKINFVTLHLVGHILECSCRNSTL